MRTSHLIACGLTGLSGLLAQAEMVSTDQGIYFDPGLVVASGSGRDIGNGGDVMYCPNAVAPRRKAEILDLYEGRRRKILALRPDGTTDYGLGDPKLPYMKKVELALKRIGRLSPRRAEEYWAEAQAFTIDPATGEYKNATFSKEGELPDVPDSGYLFVPDGCEIKQLAIQNDPIVPEDRRYEIDEDYWDLLDEDNKAALVLHELIYREALKYHHRDSRLVRYLTAYVFSDKLDRMTQKDFLGLLNTAKFVQSDVYGFQINVGQLKFNWPGLPPVFESRELEFSSQGDLLFATWEPVAGGHSRESAPARDYVEYRASNGWSAKQHRIAYLDFEPTTESVKISGGWTEVQGPVQPREGFSWLTFSKGQVTGAGTGDLGTIRGESFLHATGLIASDGKETRTQLEFTTDGALTFYLGGYDRATLELASGGKRAFTPGTWLKLKIGTNIKVLEWKAFP